MIPPFPLRPEVVGPFSDMNLVQEITHSKAISVEAVVVYRHISMLLIQSFPGGQKPWVASCHGGPIRFPWLFGEQVPPQDRTPVGYIGLQHQLLNLRWCGQMDDRCAQSEPRQDVWSRINGAAGSIHYDVFLAMAVETLHVLKDVREYFYFTGQISLLTFFISGFLGETHPLAQSHHRSVRSCELKNKFFRNQIVAAGTPKTELREPHRPNRFP
jgi:hypothetical protein